MTTTIRFYTELLADVEVRNRMTPAAASELVQKMEVRRIEKIFQTHKPLTRNIVTALRKVIFHNREQNRQEFD